MRTAYRTDQVPNWGIGAFTPVPAITPLASSAGEERRYLQQWADTPDPSLHRMAAGSVNDPALQGSTANPPPGLPLAFSAIPNARHNMSYWTTAENMGPNGPNLHMKIFSDNPLPLPAGNPGRVAVPAMGQPPWATVIATPWPRPFISWPTWGKSRQA